jgi:quinol monooxygenase YgiN
MKYTIATFAVKQEDLKSARRALAELVAAVREHEPKTLYLVFREEGLPTFITLMSFENEAAERRHAQSRYVTQFAKKLLPLCDGKPRFTELAYFAGSRKQWSLDKGGLALAHLLPLAAAHPRRGNGSVRRLPAERRVATPAR